MTQIRIYHFAKINAVCMRESEIMCICKESVVVYMLLIWRKKQCETEREREKHTERERVNRGRGTKRR